MGTPKNVDVHSNLTLILSILTFNGALFFGDYDAAEIMKLLPHSDFIFPYLAVENPFKIFVGEKLGGEAQKI